jgi:hypothetical protein
MLSCMTCVGKVINAFALRDRVSLLILGTLAAIVVISI